MKEGEAETEERKANKRRNFREGPYLVLTQEKGILKFSSSPLFDASE